VKEEEIFTPIARLKCEYQRAGLLLRTWMRYGHLHQAEINPFRVIWTDPQLITHAYGAVIPKGCRFLSIILDGEWDSPEHLVAEIPQYKMLVEHFKLGKDWIETGRVKGALLELEKEGTCWIDCHSKSDILARCNAFDELFRSIRDGGYKTPRGIQYGKTGLARTCIPQEIVVNITRDGKFLFWDGIHRLAIARILDLPLVPVRVLARHKEWQELRDQAIAMKKGQIPPPSINQYSSHPDLAYLLE
jgi:hypothetical protein